jgi:beta-aspartyl-peptidase (threonine type)
MANNFTLIIHGGAWDIPENLHKKHLGGIEKAVRTGFDCLAQGLDAITAVIRTVMTLEDDATFDAGRGSFLNLDGEVEMDAMIMDGRDLSFGAVAAIRNVKNPVCVADAVRTKTEHCLLAGDGAGQFAWNSGFPYFPTEKLLVGRELKRYRLLKQKPAFRTRQFFEQHRGDTVGAVAMDKVGNIAAATSTGGTPNKLAGRVGDSPLIGAGTFADNGSGGASSTGWGESVMKVLLAKTACDHMGSGSDALKAAEIAISVLIKRVDGLGGVICIDPAGRPGYAYNTPYMARGYADQRGIQHIGI